uniref:Uncharacterized protein n=1 Tax=Arundo donax TaxID=35708 RepID=A0A0A9BU16_ARUDO
MFVIYQLFMFVIYVSKSLYIYTMSVLSNQIKPHH